MKLLIQAFGFYALQAAAGKHQFAHIADTKPVQTIYWVGTLLALWLHRVVVSNDMSIWSFLISAGLFVSVYLGTADRPGPLRLAFACTTTGAFLLASLFHLIVRGFTESEIVATAALLLEMSIYAMAMKSNSNRFYVLPEDMKQNGYVPSTD